ncbi:MAG: AMP-dependent synthetase and ligase [Mycobacterium sp.]|nr:AMP-dependent synthetase and ligase [Mycobacterium sp.]
MYPGTYAITTPDKPAVIMGRTGESVSYFELNARSAQLAHLLRERGLAVGDTIALFAENHLRYFEVYWAALRSGLYLTAVNRHLSPEEAAYQVSNSHAKAFITTEALSATAAQMLELIPDCPLRFMMDGTVAGFESYEAAIAGCSTEAPEYQPRGEVMLYSSGTTGRPKGIRRPLGGKTIDDPGSAGTSLLEKFLLGMDESSVYLCPAPLYHAAGLQWSAGVHELGATLVVLEKFDSEECLRVIARDRVTHSQMVPTMLVRILKLPDEVRLGYDVSSLQCIVHAAAPCPIEVKRQMIDWLGPIVSEYYAGTEGIGLTFINATDWLTHPGSVGKSVLGSPRICDENGALQPTGTVGTVYFASDRPHFEYHEDPEKTRDSRHPEHPNWATVGDIGYLDEDDYLYLTDRKSFTIISGGVNIYPAEIESCLIMHDAVSDVAVFGLPDAEMGEYVHAVVQLAPGVAESEELAAELRTFAREHLAGYKVPRVVDFRSELPRLPTGKLAKGRLRDEFKSLLTRS